MNHLLRAALQASPFGVLLCKYAQNIKHTLNGMSNPQPTTAPVAIDHTAASASAATAEYNGTIEIKVSKTLHQKLAEAAQREGVELSQYLATLLSEQNAFSSMGRAVSDVQDKLNELNRQLRLTESSANSRRERVTYDNRYIEDPDSGLND